MNELKLTLTPSPSLFSGVPSTGVSKEYVDESVAREAESRESQDELIKNLLEQEITDRKEGDSDLYKRISGVVEEIGNVETSYNELYKADITLKSDIQAENERAEKTERELSNSIKNLGSDLTGKLNYASNKVDQETSRATREEANLKNSINLVKKDLESEVAARKSTDNSLLNNIATSLDLAKKYTDQKTAGALKFKGTCLFKDLPRTAEVGDFWTVTDKKNGEYAWTGTAWELIGEGVDLSGLEADISRLEGEHSVMNANLELEVNNRVAATEALETALENKENKGTCLPITGGRLAGSLQVANNLLVDWDLQVDGSVSSGLDKNYSTPGMRNIVPTAGSIYSWLERDNRLVHTTADETIGGKKTFTNEVTKFNTGEINTSGTQYIRLVSGSYGSDCMQVNVSQSSKEVYITSYDKGDRKTYGIVNKNSNSLSSVSSGCCYLVTGNAVASYLDSKEVYLTSAEYQALENKDPNVTYYITEDL